MPKNTDITTLNTEILPIANNSFEDTFRDNIDVSLGTLSSKNRIDYEKTFNQWQAYCNDNNHFAYNFDLMLVKDFLTNNEWSFNTRKVKLAHIRKYAEILAHSDRHGSTDFAYNYGRLALLKPKSLGGKKDIIKHRALSDKQVYTLFNSVSSTSNRDVRDTAILGLLLFGGLRSSEVASLLWSDCDFMNDILFIRNGKGGKSANVPMLGDLKLMLLRWQFEQSKHGNYDYVVCAVYRSDKLGPATMCSSGVISTITRRLSSDTGINFKPHDTRRTAITSLIDNGASVADVRDFARHSNGDTTLRYAVNSNAKSLGAKLSKKLKYGTVLDDIDISQNTLIYGCSNGHIFQAIKPDFCPICGDNTLSEQLSLGI